MSGHFLSRRNLLSGVALASSCSRGIEFPTKGSPGGSGRIYAAEDFGAQGDGLTDDTAAFERALSTLEPGEVLSLIGGKSYRITRSLIFTRPIVLAGGTKEDTKLQFYPGHYASLGGETAAMIFPHERTGIAHASARRSSLIGITIEWRGHDQRLHGCLISAPIYFQEVDVRSFPGDGFHIEATSGKIAGNANGGSFFNCSSLTNEEHGFSFVGNDANAIILLGARAFDNGGDGFHDESLIGNTYICAEADGNAGAGYFSPRDSGNSSVYLGCYAEHGQRFDLNGRNLVLGPLAAAEVAGAPSLRALPSGDILLEAGLVIAEGIDEVPEGRHPAFFRASREGLTLRYGDGQQLRLQKLLSENYIDILNGNSPVIRFPKGHVSGNLMHDRPWLPSGFVVGEAGLSGVLGAGDSPPTKGGYQPGAIWLNEAPARGKYLGWICVSGGTPGQWRPFGKIE